MFYPECGIPMYVSEDINVADHFDAAGVDVFTHVHGDPALGVEHDVVPLYLDGDIAMISFAP